MEFLFLYCDNGEEREIKKLSFDFFEQNPASIEAKRDGLFEDC
jgi:hypothetical protein